MISDHNICSNLDSKNIKAVKKISTPKSRPLLKITTAKKTANELYLNRCYESTAFANQKQSYNDPKVWFSAKMSIAKQAGITLNALASVWEQFRLIGIAPNATLAIWRM
jgi:hypothetical protein